MRRPAFAATMSSWPRLTRSPDAVSLDPEEAEAAEWVTLGEAAGRCWPVKRPTYDRLAADWCAAVGGDPG